jgi:hypothetical protein
MEAKELRIGNAYRDCTSKEIRFITGFSEDGVYYNDGFDFYESMLNVILTEEWLVKFGFVKDKKHNNCCDLELENDFYLQGVGYGKSNIKYEVILTDSNDNELTLVKHVHQLQNLYFALTNEELKLT